MKTVVGDLIEMFKSGEFDLIAHGCNCFNTMGAGIAKAIAKEFPDVEKADKATSYGHINKLGTVMPVEVTVDNNIRIVINAYTQYYYGGSRPLDYEALTLCMRKINHMYKGKKIGLPKIGAGLGGGDWDEISGIIKTELDLMDVTIVVLPK